MHGQLKRGGAMSARILSVVLAVLLFSSPGTGAAQPGGALTMDTGLLIQKTFNLNCDFSIYRTAQDCIGRILPTLKYKTDSYVASKATYTLKVTYTEFKDVNNAGLPMTSRGTAFLIDAGRRYLLTSKHVLVGHKAWSTVLQNHPYPTLEAAVEAYLSSPRVSIQVSSPEEGAILAGRLVALSRDSDLALLTVDSLNAFQITAYESLFKPITIAQANKCDQGFLVSAVGYIDGQNPGAVSQKFSAFSPATCDTVSKDYYIGDQLYRILLNSTGSPFEPGFSGGPVLDGDMHLVGVVSGATNQPGAVNTSFFVPISEVQAFIRRF